VTGRFAAAGELASTILAPGQVGYHPYDLYPTPDGRGDPNKAKALLAQAGYPHRLIPGFATLGSGRLAATRKPIEASLLRAGIHLKVTTDQPGAPHFEALGNPAKRLEHQLAQSGWALDHLGDNARQSIVPQDDSRIPADVGADFSEYDNPAVNRLIDRALAEPSRDAGRPCGPSSTSGSCGMRPGAAGVGAVRVPVGPEGPRLGVRPLRARARPHRRVAGPAEFLTAAVSPARPSRRGHRSQQVSRGVPAATCPGHAGPRHCSA
jgi:hypothetical protein